MRKSTTIARPLLSLLAVLVACAAPAALKSAGVPHEAATRAKHVLFIGNSLTYHNDLPATVAAIAASAGDTFHTALSAGPNMAIIDHLGGGSNAVAKMKSQKWDYIVLQQGPTTNPMCRDSLVLWTKTFDPYIRAASAQPALFMPWPQNAQWGRMDLVRFSFQTAAEGVDGIFLPAGEAWRIAHEADTTVALYGSDKFHPTELGSYLAALTIYERLSGRDARTLPRVAYAGSRVLTSITAETVARMQEAAHAANALYPPTSRTTDRPAPAPPVVQGPPRGC